MIVRNAVDAAATAKTTGRDRAEGDFHGGRGVRVPDSADTDYSWAIGLSVNR
jgi:hypothetical protein